MYDFEMKKDTHKTKVVCYVIRQGKNSYIAKVKDRNELIPWIKNNIDTKLSYKISRR